MARLFEGMILLRLGYGETVPDWPSGLGKPIRFTVTLQARAQLIFATEICRTPATPCLETLWCRLIRVSVHSFFDWTDRTQGVPWWRASLNGSMGDRKPWGIWRWSNSTNARYGWPKRCAMTFEAIRRIALALDNVEEGTSYGTPAFKVGGVLFARLRDDIGALVLRMSIDDRQELIAADPETYFITDHYLEYPYILVNLARVIRMRCGICWAGRAGWRGRKKDVHPRDGASRVSARHSLAHVSDTARALCQNYPWDSACRRPPNESSHSADSLPPRNGCNGRRYRKSSCY